MTLVRPVEGKLPDRNSFETADQLVRRYFELFNRGEFHQVAQLFAAEGKLYPPFESPVVGQEAIAAYLIEEADGMELEPFAIEAHPCEGESRTVDVRGKVTALVFTVNVAWSFVLTTQSQIESVRVDLLASLEELLKIRPSGATLP